MCPVRKMFNSSVSNLAFLSRFKNGKNYMYMYFIHVRRITANYSTSKKKKKPKCIIEHVTEHVSHFSSQAKA